MMNKDVYSVILESTIKQHNNNGLTQQSSHYSYG